MRSCTLCLVMLFVVLALSGCGPAFLPDPLGRTLHAPAPDHTAAVLNWLLIPALLGIALGVVLLVWIPIKRFGLAIVAGSGALVVSVLWAQAILPYMKWFALATGVGALAWLAFVAWQKSQHLAGVNLNPSPLVRRWVAHARHAAAGLQSSIAFSPSPLHS